MSKFIPVLFSTSMIQAILEGRKTMTRRVINFKQIAKQSGCTKGTLAYSDTFNSWAIFNGNGEADLCLIDCPYGKKGDILWVREKFRVNQTPTGFFYHFYTDDDYTDKDNEKWKPSLFMPKSACRIFLEITNVRVERLNEISEKDAINEGVHKDSAGWYEDYLKQDVWNRTHTIHTAKRSFGTLWQSINGRESMESNPFVWVIEFKRVEKPEGFI